jgi:hypothetical protein
VVVNQVFASKMRSNVEFPFIITYLRRIVVLNYSTKEQSKQSNIETRSDRQNVLIARVVNMSSQWGSCLLRSIKN